MPETYGKRQRQGVKARKAAAREERRLQRSRRRAARAEDPGAEHDWLAEPPPRPEDIPAAGSQEPADSEEPDSEQ
jgi:hypothetical protein